jgi:hypothetical protein
MANSNSPLQILQNIHNANKAIASLPYQNRIILCFPELFGIKTAAFGQIKFGNSSETKPLTIDLIGQIAHTDLYCPKQDGTQLDGSIINFDYDLFLTYISGFKFPKKEVSPTFRDWWIGERFNAYISKFDVICPHDFFINGIKIPAQTDAWATKVKSMFSCLK